MSNKLYIFCYCKLNYDDNLIFNLNVSYMSFLIISLTIFVTFKEIYKEHCPIFIKTSIGKKKTRITNFGSIIDHHLIFDVEWVKKNTCQ